MALFAHELGSRPDTVMKLSFGPELEPRCSETTASCTNYDFHSEEEGQERGRL
jgi:hypothetical protein